MCPHLVCRTIDFYYRCRCCCWWWWLQMSSFVLVPQSYKTQIDMAQYNCSQNGLYYTKCLYVRVCVCVCCLFYVENDHSLFLKDVPVSKMLPLSQPVSSLFPKPVFHSLRQLLSCLIITFLLFFFLFFLFIISICHIFLYLPKETIFWLICCPICETLIW